MQSESCSACGRELTAGARFCAACGTPANGAGTAAAASPSALAAPPAPTAPVAERRVTSVLFGDLVGFTTLSESRDPEEVRELLSGYFERCRTVVARYGGTIEKFIGDAVMAVWGVPLTHEDDAERAVRAGLDLVEATAAFGARAGAPGLAMRVGVVTGEVAVTIGATAEGMVAGDAVNTAARVQGAARPGTVWIDEQTRQLTSAAVESVSTGDHALKGKATPVALFEVIAVMGAVGGAQRVDRVEAPLTGRRGELAMIKESFHAAIEDGRGRLLLVSGQPGVGKSRLGWELEKYTDGLSDAVRWHWGRCLSYGDGVAFSSLSAAVRGRVGATDADTAEDVRAKVAASIARYVAEPSEREWLAPRVALLLTGESDQQFGREDLFAAWVAWFEALGADGAPVVWVVDDAQYADDGILDFLEHLVAVVHVGLLVVVLARPELLERRPQLVTSRRSMTLTLEGLSPLAMAGLYERLVPGLPTAVVEQLATRAEGVPLYAVEAVRSMLDRGLLTDDGPQPRTLAPGVAATDLLGVSAPASLQILISSRLDTLPPAERALLGTAAVLGTSFTADGLAALTQLEAGVVAERLAPLLRRDLLRIVTDRLSAEFGQYAFVQTLLRQVVYQTQSRRDRAERHLAAAEYLQRLPESSGQLTAVIAGHLGDALDLLPTNDARRATIPTELLVWLESAAERSRSVGAMHEALANWDAALVRITDATHAARIRLAAATAANIATQFDRAIAYTDPLFDDAAEAATVPLDLVADALAQRSKALRNTGRVRAAHDLLVEWQARTAALPSAAGSALNRELAACMHQLGQLEQAGPIAERAARLAEYSARPDLIVLAMNVVANGYDDGGLPRLAAAVYRGAADLARTHHLLAELNMVLGNLAAVELNQDPRAGIRASYEAIELAAQIGDSYSVVGAAGNLAEMLRGVGDWDDALGLTDIPLLADALATGLIEVRAVVLNAGLIALARGQTPPTVVLDVDGDPDGFEAVLSPLHDAVAAAHHGDPGAAYELTRPSVLSTREQHGLSARFSLLWTACVDWAIEAGRHDDAGELLALVEQAPAGQATPVLRAQVARLRATVSAATAPDDDGVEVQLQTAIAALIAIDYRPDLARTRVVLAGWLAAHGRDAEAAEQRTAARTTFTDLRAGAWLDALDALDARGAGRAAAAS